MTSGSVADIIHRGGTVLLTARCPEFESQAGQKVAALENLYREGIEGLIVIGGEGTLKGALSLAHKGFPVVGVPATIDNDIWGTDYSIGFDTAVNTAVEAIARIRDTATSHERVFIIEVMGRHTGHTALAAGIAAGAESILIPEFPIDYREVAERIERGRRRSKLHSIIVVAEGVGKIEEVAREIRDRTRLESRITILGHIQRGEAPTAFDCLLASRLGSQAVKLLVEGKKGVMVGVEGKGLVVRNLEEVLSRKKLIDPELYKLAQVLAL